jgi:hypothetical protein
MSTVATSQFISPNTYIGLSEETICAWRKITYDNLDVEFTFNKKELLALPAVKIQSLDDIKDSIYDRIFYYKQSGQMVHKESIFVMIDSCILGKYTIPTIITKMKETHNISKKNIILVVSNINKIENNYKLIKKYKYPQINFKKLEFNLDILSGKVQLKMKNVVVINTDISFDNKILIQEEINYLHNYGKWTHNIRNEINDIAQLEILETIINMFPNINGWLITQDRRLLKKVNNKNFERIQSFTF